MKRYTVIDTDCESDVWFDNVENKPLDYKDIEKILEKQVTKWQKLKEWLGKCCNLKEKNTFMSFETVILIVKNKMQELEGE